MRTQNFKKGFVVMEILIFLAVIAMLTPIAFQLMKVSENSNKISITKTRVKALSDTFERVFYENLLYVEQNCYGWNDVSCANLSATPVVKDSTTLTFNTFDAMALNSLIGVGCQVTGSAPTYDVQCYDGYGNLMQFAGTNLHSTGTQYIAPYQNNYPQITIQTTNAVNTILDISGQVNTALIHTEQKVNEVANAIKSFVRAKRIAELGNTCGGNNGASDPAGGLTSMDDTVVPFVWEAFSVNPATLCSGIEDTTGNCGCSSHTNSNNWETSINYCTIDTDVEISRFLANLSLGNKYKTDGLGNTISIVPLADNNGNEVTCPPPRPQINYSGLSSLPKTRIGITNSLGTWVYYTDIFSE